MTLPLFTPMRPRSVAAEIMQEARAHHDRRIAAMSPEQLMKLERQIENLRERGNRGEDTRERLRELRRTHFQETGASGG